MRAFRPPPLKLALKIDVDTYRGTREGCRLVEMLKAHGAGATFLFSLGPDHTGGPSRASSAGFLGKWAHLRLSHYGIRTSSTGRCSPGRHRQALRVHPEERARRGVRGRHPHWDHVKWQDGVGRPTRPGPSGRWRSPRPLPGVFAQEPKVHGGGWQMNVHAWRRTQRFGFDYCSDSRDAPFLPVCRPRSSPARNSRRRCPPWTSSSPGRRDRGDRGGRHPGAHEGARDHVFTLHAELRHEARPFLERLLAGWKAQGTRSSRCATSSRRRLRPCPCTRSGTGKSRPQRHPGAAGPGLSSFPSTP